MMTDYDIETGQEIPCLHALPPQDVAVVRTLRDVVDQVWKLGCNTDRFAIVLTALRSRIAAELDEILPPRPHTDDVLRIKRDRDGWTLLLWCGEHCVAAATLHPPKDEISLRFDATDPNDVLALSRLEWMRECLPAVRYLMWPPVEPGGET